MSATPAAHPVPPPPPPEFVLRPTASGIRRAAELLAQGKLVILPTETVYGIALSLHSPAARAAALAIKARNAELGGAGGGAAKTPWVVHAESAEALLSWVPHISALGRRLISKAVPGPVAFQVKLDAEDERSAKKRLSPGGMDEGAAEETISHDGGSYLALRCPDFGMTQDVIAAVGQPVAIVGAGTRAQPAVFELPDLPAQVFAPTDGGESLIRAGLDGGPTRYRRSSTVVRIDGENYAVVRPGVIDERIIHKLADFTILFLCSGNTCRSPMAAALAARSIADKLHITPQELPLRHIVVQSAGLHAARGMRATMEGMEAVKALGGDLSGHISQPATPDLLRRADVIYTMTDGHRDEVLELIPGAERKTFRLDPEGDIADPIGSPFPVYERVARRLLSVLGQRLSELPV